MLHVQDAMERGEFALSVDVARVQGKCLCHMSQGLWQISRRDMTSPCPTPRQMSRHVAMFPQFCAHRGSDGVSEVEKSAPLLKSSLLSQKLPRNAVKTARITRKTWVSIPLFLPQMTSFGRFRVHRPQYFGKCCDMLRHVALAARFVGKCRDMSSTRLYRDFRQMSKRLSRHPRSGQPQTAVSRAGVTLPVNMV